MSERRVPVGGIELCVETFGDPGDPAILLIGGRSSAMDWWEREFCERLAEGRQVIRYDLRDTGRSTTCPPGAPDYTSADLVEDAAGLLAALGQASAHIVGISMGGAIAQVLAVTHPQRVRSLSLIATTPALRGAPEGLPGPAPELLEFFAAAEQRPAPDWTDRAAMVEMLTEDQRAFQRSGFDADRIRAVAAQVVERSIDLAAMGNHGMLESGPEPEATMADIAVPTLVLHGDSDPLFPPAHGRALAAAIPGARLLILAGAGHEPPPPSTWDVAIPALHAHTAAATG